MYTCNSCSKSFQNPKYAYSKEDGADNYKISTSDDPDFSAMAYLHEDSWIYCPYCGSDQITDHEEIDNQ